MTNKPTSQLKDTFFSQIEERNVQPRSRWFFLCKEYSTWLFWSISVLVGAVSVAVSIFVLSHRQYALYEATHDNFWTFMVEVLPYMWFVLFGLMAGAAWFNFRQTKRGYKQSLWKVIIGSVSLSVLGGFVLQSYGLGYQTDKMLGDRMDTYMSQDKMERKLWQAPQEGRLLGQQIVAVDAVATGTRIVFKDEQGHEWDMQIVDLFDRDKELLRSQRRVRVLGSTTDAISRQFHACGVFPWMVDGAVSMRELDQERKAFVQKVYDQKHKAEDRLALLEQDTFTDLEAKKHMNMGICAEIAAVRRISAQMQR